MVLDEDLPLPSVMKRKRDDTETPRAATSTTSGPRVKYTLETLPSELQKYRCFGDCADVDTGISGIGCIQGTMTGSGWTRRLGIA